MRKFILISFILACIPLFIFSQEQIENPGFEEWEDAGTVLYEPVDWSSIKTSDHPGLSDAAPVVWGQSDDSHSGNFSVYLFNVYVSLIQSTAAGTLTNGQVHASVIPAEGYVFTNPDSTKWHTPFQSKPDSLIGWFKYNPMEGDTGGIRVITHVGEGKLPANGTEDNWIAEANHKFPGYVVNEWTRFSVPFEKYSENTPEYILFVIKAGNGTQAIEDSELWLDDLKLIYNDPGGIDDLSEKETFMYYHNGFLNFKPMVPDFYKNAEIYLYDMNGHMVYQHKIAGNRIKPDQILPEGIYIGKIVSGEHILTQKVYIY